MNERKAKTSIRVLQNVTISCTGLRVILIDAYVSARELRSGPRTYRFPHHVNNWCIQQASDSRSRQQFDECRQPGGAWSRSRMREGEIEGVSRRTYQKENREHGRIPKATRAERERTTNEMRYAAASQKRQQTAEALIIHGRV